MFVYTDAVVSVLLVFDKMLQTERLEALSELLQARFRYYELLIVGSPSLSFFASETRIQQLPHCRIIVANCDAPEHTLRRLGMTQAIGDYVVTLDLAEAEPHIVPLLLEQAMPEQSMTSQSMANTAQDVDFVGTEYAQNGSVHMLASKIFTKILNWLTGYQLNDTLSTTGSYSRSLVNAIIAQDRFSMASTRLLLASLSARSSILSERVQCKPYTLSNTFRRIASSMAILGTVPQRMLLLVAWLSLLLGIGNLCYLFYVLAVFTLFPTVQAGWTTTSMLLNVFGIGIFFSLFVFASIFSAQLAQGRRESVYIAREETSQQHVVHTDFMSHIENLNVTDKQ